jgi:hypothetical protein
VNIIHFAYLPYLLWFGFLLGYFFILSWIVYGDNLSRDVNGAILNFWQYRGHARKLNQTVIVIRPQFYNISTSAQFKFGLKIYYLNRTAILQYGYHFKLYTLERGG